jgi:hypothetical protein
MMADMPDVGMLWQTMESQQAMPAMFIPFNLII